MSFSVGDSVTMTVNVTSKTGGIATIKNNSKGTFISHIFANEATDLCPTNADWIVEKYSQAYADSSGHVSFQKIPIVNMGTVTFTNASATTVDGKLVDAWNARTNVIDLVQDGHKLLASTIEDSSISVSYVGNGRT